MKEGWMVHFTNKDTMVRLTQCNKTNLMTAHFIANVCKTFSEYADPTGLKLCHIFNNHSSFLPAEKKTLLETR
jgi:hypothetical protein